MRTENKVLIFGLSMMAIGILFAVAYGLELPPIGQWVSCDDSRYSIGGHGLCDFPSGEVGSNSTSTSNMTLDCIRMFYSDSYNKGYVEDLNEYCNTLK
jgi:hypothetical protein